MEEQVTTDQQAVQQLYDYAADYMVNQGKSPEETKAQLVQKGLDEASAAMIVDKLEEAVIAAKRERANKDMLYGALWCIGGTAVTLGTMSAASGGGHYVITWGAIVFGAIQFFKGLANRV